MLGGSWVVRNGLISRVTIPISHIRRLITPLITIHEPPSNPKGSSVHFRSSADSEPRHHDIKRLCELCQAPVQLGFPAVPEALSC